MQVKKQQLELDMEQQTGSKLSKEYIKAVYRHSFVSLINESIDKFGTEDRNGALVIQGDNRKIMPIPCDHAIFSPPYSDVLSGTGMKDVGRGISDESMKRYSGGQASPFNLGRMSTFLYAQHMKRVYELLGQSVKMGGTMTILIKDRMRGGVREHLSEACIKACNEAGFSLWEWHKWKAPGTGQQKLMKSKGFSVVEDEDILIFRREER